MKHSLVGSVGLALLAFAGCSSPMKNKPAPDFELEALDDSKVVLSELRGKPVLLSFWGST